MYLARLSQENPALSAYEATTLGNLRSTELINHHLLLFSKQFDFTRLAYTKSVHRILIRTTTGKLSSAIKKTSLNKHYTPSYAARIIALDKPSPLSEQELGSLLWHRLDHPIVDLTHPTTTFTLFLAKKEAILTVNLWENNEDFSLRKAHRLPSLHPTGMHPKLSRALVNILRTKSFLDPFCGSGGLLIEGKLLGCTVSGSDIDPLMLSRARQNITSLGLAGIPLAVADATTLRKKTEGILTDLPYGRNSKVTDLRDTYCAFLKNAEHLTKRMVVIFPDFVPVKPLLKGTHWKIEKTFTYYLHHTLSRNIVILTLT